MSNSKIPGRSKGRPKALSARPAGSSTNDHTANFMKTPDRFGEYMSTTDGLNEFRLRRKVLGGLIGAGLAASMGTARAQTASRKWSVWVVPQFRAEVIHRSWTPVLQRLSQVTGLNFSLTVAPSIPAFEKALLAGEPDLAYQNPYHQVMSRKAQGYIPLARDKKELSGILVVRRDDPITATSGLDQKTVAFPAPNAFGASLWIRALLAERDKVSIRPSYVKTHSNAYRSVASGLSAAAGGINLTFEEEPAEIRNSLRILLETPGVAPHPLSAHPRMPGELRDLIRRALLGLASDPATRQAMDDIPWQDLVAADHDRDYRPLERFGLEKYVVKSEG